MTATELSKNTAVPLFVTDMPAWKDYIALFLYQYPMYRPKIMALQYIFCTTDHRIVSLQWFMHALPSFNIIFLNKQHCSFQLI